MHTPSIVGAKKIQLLIEILFGFHVHASLHFRLERV